MEPRGLIPFNSLELEDCPLINGKADSTYSKNEGFTKNGRHKTRLKLSEGEDNRLNIAVRQGFKECKNPIKFIDRKLNCVKLAKNLSIYVNVKSVASRLHLSKKLIKAASKDGTLLDLIQTTANHQNKIIKNYEHILDSFFVEELEKDLAISPAILMKVIRTSIPILFDPQSPESGISMLFRKNRVLMARRVEDRFELALSTLEQLGQGGFGVVWKCIRLTNDKELDRKYPLIPHEELALKIAKNSIQAQDDLKKEYLMLQQLHQQNPNPNTPLRGIQEKPHQFVELLTSSYEEPNIYGYLGKKYDGNLRNCYSYPMKVKLKQASDILAGLAFLADQNIIHGDIKPENIFFKKEFDGTITTFISDLGSAISMQSPRWTWGVHTRKYVSRKHLDKAEENERRDLVINSILLQNDVFATGIVLYKFLSGGNYPCERDRSNYAINDFKFNRTLLMKLGVPEEIINLIKEMLNVEPTFVSDPTLKYPFKPIRRKTASPSGLSVKKALTMQEVFERFEEAMIQRKLN